MLAALCFAPLPPAMSAGQQAQLLGRLVAAVTFLAVGSWAAAPVLFCQGRRAVRRFAWDSEGAWRLQLVDSASVDGAWVDGAWVDGAWQPARLIPATATLGPWILLVWQTAGRRRYALIDVCEVGAPVFRSLRARLRLIRTVAV